jgi:hypothetical protein
VDKQRKIDPSVAEVEQFWADGRDARQSATGEHQPQPETTSQFQRPATTAHGICRHCGRAISCEPNGIWTHANGPLCGLVAEDRRALFAAEPVGIDTPGVGVVAPGVPPVVLRSGREDAGGETGERSPGFAAGGQSPQDLLYKLAEEVCEQNPRLALEPYAQLKAVALKLAERVLAISKSESKEAAGDGESLEAGDGIRPRGLGSLHVLVSLLMFEHVQESHHADLCEVCRSAFEYGIKPMPIAADGRELDGLYADIQRKENANGDGYFGAFSKQLGGAR